MKEWKKERRKLKNSSIIDNNCSYHWFINIVGNIFLVSITVFIIVTSCIYMILSQTLLFCKYIMIYRFWYLLTWFFFTHWVYLYTHYPHWYVLQDQRSDIAGCCFQWSLCYSCWHQCCSNVVSWHQSLKCERSVDFVKGWYLKGWFVKGW